MSDLSVPLDARLNAELCGELLERGSVRPVPNDVEVRRRFHRRHRMEEMVQTLLLVQATDEQQPRAVARVTGLEEGGRHRHRRNVRMNAGHKRLGFLFEPPRNCGYCRG